MSMLFLHHLCNVLSCSKYLLKLTENKIFHIKLSNLLCLFNNKVLQIILEYFHLLFHLKQCFIKLDITAKCLTILNKRREFQCPMRCTYFVYWWCKGNNLRIQFFVHLNFFINILREINASEQI